MILLKRSDCWRDSGMLVTEWLISGWLRWLASGKVDWWVGGLVSSCTGLLENRRTCYLTGECMPA